jgi:replicative DNA helicase
MTDDVELTQPPHDVPAEQAAVGAAIQSSEALAAVVDTCPPERFYRPAHEKILDAALALYGGGEPVDPVAVAAELDRRGELTRCGGAPYLHTLMTATPTTSNAAYYAEIVADKAVLRDLVNSAGRIDQIAREPHGRGDDPAATVERARALLDAVASDARPGDDAVWTARQLGERALARYASPAPDGIPTGWRDIDRALPAGLRPGTLVVVGARPKVGKSMIGVALPLQVAQAGRPTAIVSLEMPEAELVDRVIAQMSGVPLDASRT